MQPTQDKEFDKLFKESLYDAEVEPSAGLWSSIESEITPRKRKFSLHYWLVAASILLLATITLVVYRQEMATTPKFANVPPLIKNAEKVERNLATAADNDKKLTGNNAQILAVKSSQVLAKKQHVIRLAKIDESKLIVSKESQALTAKSGELPRALKELNEVFVAVEAKPLHEQMVLAAVEQLPQETANTEERVAATKGIKSAGDLINLVVGAVDKGPNKFIRFKTNDEGSTLAAVNIGPFRFGKRTD